ncbi:MAG: hypothetical protein KDE26_28035, partial [Bacteroidetes bacterium]|nr:hypothetical protein [Bacteroidota bacterium]
MKITSIYGLSAILFAFILTSGIYFFRQKKQPNPQEKLENMHYPYDQFFLQRSWPDTAFNLKAYENAIKFTKRQIQQNQQLPSRNANNGIGSDWTLQGPGNIGGRFNVVTIHPASNDTMYAGSASGGVFKTVDAGQNWLPIFDDQSYLSVSAITLDPNNPDIIYVGTGDHNISGYPFIGDGIYKSMDGGATWAYIGLKDTRIISRIIIDPTNSNIIYAATMGIPFVKNNDRGLYKSTDGGATWNQILFVADQAGIIDLVIHPTNPQILYVSSWDRIRNNSESIVTGVNAKIWKTT